MVTRLALALVLVWTLGCGRVHDVAPGTYAFTVTDASRDGCAIASRGGALWTMTFDSYGHVVKASYDLFGAALADDVQLVGQYRYSIEDFYADGTLSGPDGAPVAVTGPTGVACEVDIVSVHLTGAGEGLEAPLSATSFVGALEVELQAPAPDACVCTSVLQYRAVLQ